MDQALTLNSPIIDKNLTKLTETRTSVIKEMKNKVNDAEVTLIINKLKENNILVTGEFKNIKDLSKYLKKTLNELDYNKAESIIESIDKQFDSMITSLENGSTNAFTKFMNSDLSTSIAKSLGISLTGNALLVLAPTLGTKALVAGGMGAYYLANSLKNRKEIKNVNANNELNNILFEIETTKENGKFIDTRFSEEIQNDIRKFLKNNNIFFEDTGYKSLKNAIYNLDYEKKLSLANILNSKLGKNINIEERIKKAKKKINVVASTLGTAASGLALGTTIATTINNIDPALLASPINGGVIGETFGSFLASITNKAWLKKLTGSLAGIGTAVLSHISSAVASVISAENVLICGALGITGGVITSGMLNLISVFKQIKANKENKKELELFSKLDSEKYSDQNKQELETIKEKIVKKSNPEAILIDLVVGSLKDKSIYLQGEPNNAKELTNLINKLPAKDKKEARIILKNIDNALKNNKELISNKLSQIATYTAAFTLSGFSALSIYDVIKSGKFLPELSQKLFKENNIHTPVQQIYDNPNLLKETKITETDRIDYRKKYSDIINIKELNKKKDLIKASGESLDEYLNENILPRINKSIENMSGEELLNFYNTIETMPGINKNTEEYKMVSERLIKEIEKKANSAGEKLYNELSDKAVSMDSYQAAKEYFDTDTGNTLVDAMNATTKMNLESKDQSVTFLDNTLGYLIRLFDSDFTFLLEENHNVIPKNVIEEYLRKRTPEEISLLKRFISSNSKLNQEYVESINNRIDKIISEANDLQNKNNKINEITSKVGKNMIPITVLKEMKRTLQKKKNDEKYANIKTR